MFRIFGPPGTGKTTKLLNMVDQALESGIHPSQIAFLAFTRKAANEAKERAAERFQLNAETDLYYFRTLHSLAYRLLNIKEKDLMQAKHYKELGAMIGFQLNQVKTADMEDGKSGISEHPILSIINLSRLKKISLKEQYNKSNIRSTWHEVEYVATAYDDTRKRTIWWTTRTCSRCSYRITKPSALRSSCAFWMKPRTCHHCNGT